MVSEQSFEAQTVRVAQLYWVMSISVMFVGAAYLGRCFWKLWLLGTAVNPITLSAVPILIGHGIMTLNFLPLHISNVIRGETADQVWCKASAFMAVSHIFALGCSYVNVAWTTLSVVSPQKPQHSLRRVHPDSESPVQQTADGSDERSPEKQQPKGSPGAAGRNTAHQASNLLEPVLTPRQRFHHHLRRTILWGIVSWLLGCTLATVYALQGELGVFHSLYCCISDPAKPYSTTIYMTAIMGFSSAVFILYYRAFLALKQYDVELRLNNSFAKESDAARAVLRQGLSMVATFLVCWLPVSLNAIVELSGRAYPLWMDVIAACLLKAQISWDSSALERTLDRQLKRKEQESIMNATEALPLDMKPVARRIKPEEQQSPLARHHSRRSFVLRGAQQQQLQQQLAAFSPQIPTTPLGGAGRSDHRSTPDSKASLLQQAALVGSGPRSHGDSGLEMPGTPELTPLSPKLERRQSRVLLPPLNSSQRRSSGRYRFDPQTQASAASPETQLRDCSPGTTATTIGTQQPLLPASDLVQLGTPAYDPSPSAAIVEG